MQQAMHKQGQQLISAPIQTTRCSLLMMMCMLARVTLRQAVCMTHHAPLSPLWLVMRGSRPLPCSAACPTCRLARTTSPRLGRSQVCFDNRLSSSAVQMHLSGLGGRAAPS